ncbi:hypothetical protein QDX21_09230 [Auritidibacter ignavus]|uniref:Ig-like domain-containing protein n=2 Tax=Micrococcaceae TaxID=1268 RepID=A0AAJ6AFR1_9MICC|nr:hypothetical protein [Auritidibacter ignavus]WGH92493.1 hypothetical protein QDX21_09230 [Auritidibacter ignavus]
MIAIFFTTETAKMLMPRTVADGLIKDTINTSTVAEFVTEGAEKSATTGGFTSLTATPKKAQVTMRFNEDNEEVQWADEDHQLSRLRGTVSCPRSGPVSPDQSVDWY